MSFCYTCKQYYQPNLHNIKNCEQIFNYYKQAFVLGKRKGWHNVLDFTMTACNRVELIEPTCQTLKQNIRDVNLKKCTIYCNLDPLLIPDTEDNVKKCLEKYFDTVIMNKPDKPSFVKALKWCWKNSKKTLTFHLEDDWKFLAPFKVENMFRMMINLSTVSSVQLYKGEAKKGQTGLIRLSPSLHKTEYIKQMADMMNNKDNPEGQLRHNGNANIRGGVAIYLGLCFRPNTRLVRDIGVEWRESKNIEHKVFFNSWNVR